MRRNDALRLAALLLALVLDWSIDLRGILFFASMVVVIVWASWSKNQ